jgi:hypothetical protein
MPPTVFIFQVAIVLNDFVTARKCSGLKKFVVVEMLKY